MSISNLRKRVAASASLGVLLASTTAFASQDFPEQVADQLGMECPPPCTICHDSQSGGAGTARKPFGQAMQNEGLEAANDDSLKAALEALEAAGTDSDADGTGDIEELRASSDPNISGSASICGPAFGCGAHVASSQRVDPIALLLALGVGGFLFGLARRRGPQRG